MKKFLTILPLLLLFVIFSSNAAFATNHQGSFRDKSNKSVINQITLLPEDGSAVLKNVKLEELADGSYKKTFSGTIKLDDGPVGYSIKINKDKKTYSATELDLSNNSEYNSIISRAPMYSKQVKLLTYDPIGLDVCYTKAILYWYNGNDYSIYSDGGHATWAANPTPQPFNTHWYVDSDSSWREDDPMRNAVGQRALGSFHNSDFGDNDKKTFIDHDVSVLGFSDGTIDYNGIEYADGEANLLLTTSIYVY